MKTLHKIIIGDSRQMKEVPDESVHLIKYGNQPKVNHEIKEQSKLTQEEWNQCFTGHWNFPGEKQDKHLAMFPEELPKRLIRVSMTGEQMIHPAISPFHFSSPSRGQD